MESQKQIKEKCPECGLDLIVPTITDFFITFQTAPCKCVCGWIQKGKFNNGGGFIADNPINYFNLRNSKV